MGCLDCIDIDNRESVLGAEGESSRLDATVAVCLMVGAVERHDGGGAEKCDCVGREHCCVAILMQKSSEC